VDAGPVMDWLRVRRGCHSGDRSLPLMLIAGVVLVFCIVVASIVDRGQIRTQSPERAAETIVFVGEHLAFTVSAFARINLLLALAWIAVVAALNPAYRAQVAAIRRAPASASLPLRRRSASVP
jgi:hypothetical protein